MLQKMSSFLFKKQVVLLRNFHVLNMHWVVDKQDQLVQRISVGEKTQGDGAGGLFYIVRGGGHIELFRPLYR